MSNQNERGLTLIELLVGVILVGIIIVFVARFYVSNQQQMKIQRDVINMQQEMKHALDILTNQIRNAGYNAGETPFGKVKTYNNTRFIFRWTGNPADPDEVDSVDINLSGNQLLVNNEVLVDNVDALQFTYFNQTNGTPGNAKDIRKIQIFLRLRTASRDPHWSENGGYRQRQVTTEITPLNLALN